MATEQAPQSAPANGATPAAADHATLLAELEAFERGSAPAPAADEPQAAAPEGDAPADGAKPADADAPAADDGDKPADEPEADEDEDSEPDAAADSDEETDPKLAKNVEALNRREKRMMERVDAREREVRAIEQRLEKEWAPRVEAAERFESLKGRARYDAASVLEALGVNLQDDGELIARQVYSRSKAALAKPETREAAERALRERESASELATVRKELAEMRAEREAERTARDNEQRAAAYIAKVEKAAGDDAPLLTAYLANDPDEARGELAKLAKELYDDTGELPEHADVAAEWEKRERARLKKRGVTAPAKAAKASGAPTTKPAGKALSSTMAAPTPVKTTGRPSRDELIAELEANERKLAQQRPQQ